MVAAAGVTRVVIATGDPNPLVNGGGFELSVTVVVSGAMELRSVKIDPQVIDPKDVGMLDRLFEKTLDYFHRLEVYIAAGQEQLRRLDEATIPAMARQVQASGDVIKAQELGDLRARRDELERRVHDLKLTR